MAFSYSRIPTTPDNKSTLLFPRDERKSASMNQRPPSGSKTKKNVSKSSGLEVLESEGGVGVLSEWQNDRSSSARPRSSGGHIPPRPDSSWSLTRRTPTPTKQILLRAVKRKEESEEPFVADVDWKDLKLDRKDKVRIHGKEFCDQFSEMTVNKVEKPPATNISSTFRPKPHNCSHTKPPEGTQERVKLKTAESKARVNGYAEEEKKEEPDLLEASGGVEDENSDDTSGTSSDDSDSEEERKAPNELLMEFLGSLMEGDFVTADKLCTMILIYEPNNSEARHFQPLIQEKIQLDLESEADSEEGDEDDDEDEDDDDEDDESSDDETSSDDSSEDDEDEQKKDMKKPNTVSTSASSRDWQNSF